MSSYPSIIPIIEEVEEKVLPPEVVAGAPLAQIQPPESTESSAEEIEPILGYLSAETPSPSAPRKGRKTRSSGSASLWVEGVVYLSALAKMVSFLILFCDFYDVGVVLTHSFAGSQPEAFLYNFVARQEASLLFKILNLASLATFIVGGFFALQTSIGFASFDYAALYSALILYNLNFLLCRWNFYRARTVDLETGHVFLHWNALDSAYIIFVIVGVSLILLAGYTALFRLSFSNIFKNAQLEMAVRGVFGGGAVTYLMNFNCMLLVGDALGGIIASAIGIFLMLAAGLFTRFALYEKRNEKKKLSLSTRSKKINESTATNMDRISAIRKGALGTLALGMVMVWAAILHYHLVNWPSSENSEFQDDDPQIPFKAVDLMKEPLDDISMFLSAGGVALALIGGVTALLLSPKENKGEFIGIYTGILLSVMSWYLFRFELKNSVESIQQLPISAEEYPERHLWGPLMSNLVLTFIACFLTMRNLIYLQPFKIQDEFRDLVVRTGLIGGVLLAQVFLLVMVFAHFVVGMVFLVLSLILAFIAIPLGFYFELRADNIQRGDSSAEKESLIIR